MKFQFFKSYSFEFILVGFFVLVMLIPMAFVTSLVEERSIRKWQTLDEVSSKWGQWQAIYGPILRIPYREHYKDNEGQPRTTEGVFYSVAEGLKYKAQMIPETRHRGIYDVTLFTADVFISGSFLSPELENRDGLELLLDRSEIIFGLRDITGLEGLSSIKLNDKEYNFLPAGPEKHLSFTATATKIDLTTPNKGQLLEFQMEVRVNGTNQLYFAPLSKTTIVSLDSPWPDPSFSGRFLPKVSEITPEGFSADWEITSFKTGFPHIWKDGPLLDAYAANFGVELYVPVDIYQLTGRAAKYAILFLGLTFSTLLFVGIFTDRRIHIIQYGFIGIGISIFYLLLLSLAEHIGFNGAYAIAAVSVVSLVTAYCQKVLQDKKAVKALFAILSFLYVSLFFILQLEDYALLVGSIGLFLILAVIMMATAKVDWQQRRS